MCGAFWSPHPFLIPFGHMYTKFLHSFDNDKVRVFEDILIPLGPIHRARASKPTHYDYPSNKNNIRMALKMHIFPMKWIYICLYRATNLPIRQIAQLPTSYIWHFWYWGFRWMWGLDFFRIFISWALKTITLGLGRLTWSKANDDDDQLTMVAHVHVSFLTTQTYVEKPSITDTLGTWSSL